MVFGTGFALRSIKISAIAEYKRFTTRIGHYILYAVASIKKAIMSPKISLLVGS